MYVHCFKLHVNYKMKDKKTTTHSTWYTQHELGKVLFEMGYTIILLIDMFL